jgi:hypothetical protein
MESTAAFALIRTMMIMMITTQQELSESRAATTTAMEAEALRE